MATSFTPSPSQAATFQGMPEPASQIFPLGARRSAASVAGPTAPALALPATTPFPGAAAQSYTLTDWPYWPAWVAVPVAGLTLLRRQLPATPAPEESPDPHGGAGAVALLLVTGTPRAGGREPLRPTVGGPASGPAERPPGEEGDSPDPPPQLYPQRWVQLGYVSLLALVSDWVCFSCAAAPESWLELSGHQAEELVDLFFWCNVVSCLLFTDVADFYGLRRVVVGSACLTALGSLLRSGVPFLGDGLPSYTMVALGTVLAGLAQPFFLCSPPLLSDTWFGAKERTMATAVALNFNQVGIACAFLTDALIPITSDVWGQYFSGITVVTMVLAAGSFLQFQDRPPSPPSASTAIREAKLEEVGLEQRKLRIRFPGTALALIRQRGFRIPLVVFVASVGVTNVISTFTDPLLRRAGFLDSFDIGLSGAAFQLAMVLGGVVVSSYVDRTRQYKRTTLACCYVATVLLALLALLFGEGVHAPEGLVLAALLGVGAALGAVQPINAELAVEATYPADENAIEAFQQLCSNAFTALLVPFCGLSSLYHTRLAGEVAVGNDSFVLLLLLLLTIAAYSSFNSPLKRAAVDSAFPLHP
eukprot:EG_transcript_6150